MTHPTRPPQHPRPPSSPMEALVAVGANAGAASGAAEVLPSSNPHPPQPPHPQQHPHSYPHLHPRPHPPPPIISISPPSTPGSPLHSPIDIADANFERFHATRSPHPTSAPDTSPTSNSPDRRASLYDNNEKNFRSSLESDLDLDLELDLGLDYIDDDDCDILTNMAGYSGQARIRGSSETMQMVLLTFVMIGITFTWGIEMTYCTPYLLNLGLTKSNTALVWIAGPLSGICVQPVIGVISDESKSKWGRRRPIMVASAVLSAICMLVLGFTKEVVGVVIQDDESAKRPTIVLAVLSIYAVDFAINAVMSTSRSLIVDTLPIEKQQLGAAWSSRMSAIGHMIGYGAGALDLAAIFGNALGDTQFKQLTVIASLTILSTTALTSWAVSERVLMSSGPSKHQGILKPFRQIWATLSQLPPRIQAICWVQFWSWIGWFPFLFYSTTWIGETYFRYDISPEDRASADALGEIGRIGSTSLVIYSTITFIGAWLLPMVVQAPSDNSYTRRPPKALEGFLERFDKLKPDLLTVWVYGHLLFFVAMAMAPFATSYRFATFLVCLCGIPWTIAGWAPTTFLGIEVNKLSGASERGSYRQISDNIELNNRTSNEIPARLENGLEAASGPSSNGELSGIYFGILNIYTTIPQFIGTFISTIVFSILEPGQSPELASDSPKKADEGGPNAIAVCLFIGAMSTFVASFVTRRLRHL